MPIDDIIIDNSYLRMDDDVESLMTSIQTVGLIHPLTLNKENKLLAGGRRYTALKKMGAKEVRVEIVDRSPLEQELISIDENLVRTPLSKLEFEKCLNRGREIYEKINPDVNKVSLSTDSLSPSQKKAKKEEESMDTTSFAAITAEKTGLSKGVIKEAIKRDALSSKRVKEARSLGELNASQASEIIKLKKKDQDEILEIIQNRPTREIKKIVETVKLHGVKEGVNQALTFKPFPAEYKDIKTPLKKLNKTLAKILIEEINYKGSELKGLLRDSRDLVGRLENFLEFHEDDEDYPQHQTSDHAPMQ
ncbi:MAG: ParB N-terminal domain-containing protein [Bacteriovoracaceae bacterium]|jgi:ParB family transcriptional regulator, chromosome partitioning protein|nr:ParB N-terminal domain-containing protein [Bacteriovoracaceae bacterium]